MTDTAISPPAIEAEHAPPAAFERPDFEIVPRRGLVLVAVVAVLLIVAIESNKLWPLTFFHVAGGAAWTIIDLFLGLVLGPIIGKMSIPARIEFTTRLMPKMVLIMPTVVTATLAAGWQLGVKLGTVYSFNPLHGWVVASYIIVGVMAVLALGLLEPANIAVLVELKKPRPNPAGDRAADEAVPLLRGDPRRDADRDARDHDQALVRMNERQFPPVTELGMASLALIVAGGIYLSAHLPRHVPLGPAVALLAASVLLLVVNMVMLSRIPDFAWDRFFTVAKWSLLAYIVIAGMIEYAFLKDHVSGGSLVVLTLSLAVFAVHVPMLMGFTVARYADSPAGDRVAA